MEAGVPINSGWWFQTLWKILINWDDFPIYVKIKNVPNHQPVKLPSIDETRQWKTGLRLSLAPGRYEFVNWNDDILNIWKSEKCSSHHQPEKYFMANNMLNWPFPKPILSYLLVLNPGFPSHGWTLGGCSTPHPQPLRNKSTVCHDESQRSPRPAVAVAEATPA